MIIMADFNCNVKDEKHCFFEPLNDFMTSHNLFSAYDFMEDYDAKNCFTRYDSRSKSILDGFVISACLTDRIANVEIEHDGANLSDHSPVKIEMNLCITSKCK